MPAAHEEAIARHLAARFAPVLGAELPALTNWVLADDPADETPFRAGDPSVVLGYAGFIVGLATLAWNTYVRLTLGREVATLQSEVAALKGMVLAEMIRAAPHAPRVDEAMHSLLLSVAAELALAEAAGSGAEPTRPLLGQEEILVLYRAVVSAELTGSREALLVGVEAGFVAMLRGAGSPGEQIWRDLGAMNAVRALGDGSVPLAIWLGNAGTFAGGRAEAAVFHAARVRVDGAGKA